MLIIEPCAGLANRILALGTAYQLAKQYNHSIKLLWDVDNTVGVRVQSLFCLPPDIKVVTLTKAPFYDKPLLWVKSHLLRPIYRLKCSIQLDCDDILEKKQDENKLFWDGIFQNNCNVYIKSYCELQPICSTEIFSIFQESPEVWKRGGKVLSIIDKNTIGLHIRRTDHDVAIEHSPTELFFLKAEEVLSESPEIKIFLATDDEELVWKMKERFPGRVICHDEKEFSRKNKLGMQDSVIDLLALSRCREIYGSYGSTFSKMASYIGGCKLTILEREQI